MWIYVIWLVVLLGAEFSYACQFVDVHHRKMIHKGDSQTYRECLALAIAVYVVRSFFDNRVRWTDDAVSAEFRIPPGMASAILQRLCNHGILMSAAAGYVPARDPSGLSAADVISAMRAGVHPAGGPNSCPKLDDPSLVALFGDLDRRSSDLYSAHTLADLARGMDADLSESVPSEGDESFAARQP